MIYVDKIFDYPDSMTKDKGLKSNRWCHLWTDGNLEELCLFAESIGLKREYAQTHGWLLHFDITPYKREEALKKGAVEISVREYLMKKGRNKHGNSKSS